MNTWPIFLSALLYGLLHPVMKLLLESGLKILPLCIAIIGIRLFIDLPINFSLKTFHFQSKKLVMTLFALGMVGTFYQLCELSSISKGLPVPLIVFLIYSHPLWTVIIIRLFHQEKLPSSTLIRLIFAITGLILVAGFHLSETHGNWKLLIGPLSASFLTSLWICLINSASKQGAKPQIISLYYNFFSFVALTGASIAIDHGQSLSLATQYVGHLSTLIPIAGYALLLNALANYLFYFGSRTVPAFTAGLILLLDPMVSTVSSYLLWKDPMSIGFIFGTVCILLANAPFNFEGWISAFRTLPQRLQPNSVAAGIQVSASEK